MVQATNVAHFQGYLARELVLNGEVKGVNRVRLEIRVEGRSGRADRVPADAREIRLRQCRGGCGKRSRGAICANAKGGVGIRCHGWVARRLPVARRCRVVQDIWANDRLDKARA